MHYTMKSSVDEVKIIIKNDNIDAVKKFKYNYKGYCKYGEKCSCRHFNTIYADFVENGICKTLKSCRP